MNHRLKIRHHIDALMTACEEYEEILLEEGFTDPEIGGLCSLWSDLDYVGKSARQLRTFLGAALGERIEGEPRAVGSTVYKSKNVATEKWPAAGNVREEMLWRSAQRDSHTAVTSDGEPIPEPAYAAGWEAAATLWNLPPKSMRKGPLKQLDLDPKDLGCEVTWSKTIEAIR